MDENHMNPVPDMLIMISKFIHGCATLLPNRVDLVPFWLPQSNFTPSYHLGF